MIAISYHSILHYIIKLSEASGTAKRSAESGEAGMETGDAGIVTTCLYTYTHIYIYIYRERERCMYVYIYI